MGGGICGAEMSHPLFKLRFKRYYFVFERIFLKLRMKRLIKYNRHVSVNMNIHQIK